MASLRLYSLMSTLEKVYTNTDIHVHIICEASQACGYTWASEPHSISRWSLTLRHYVSDRDTAFKGARRCSLSSLVSVVCRTWLWHICDVVYSYVWSRYDEIISAYSSHLYLRHLHTQQFGYRMDATCDIYKRGRCVCCFVLLNRYWGINVRSGHASAGVDEYIHIYILRVRPHGLMAHVGRHA